MYNTMSYHISNSEPQATPWSLLSFFVTFSMQAALRLKARTFDPNYSYTGERHSNVMLFADLINVYACDNCDNYNKNVCFSCLSCLCNICQYIFMFCIFMSNNFMPWNLVRLFHVLQFHVHHFQRPHCIIDQSRRWNYASSGFYDIVLRNFAWRMDGRTTGRHNVFGDS